MRNQLTSRRTFLRYAAATGAMVAAGRSALTAETQSTSIHPIRLGGPTFEAASDPEQLALAHRKLGYRAAYCPGIPITDTKRIADTAAAFAKHDVVLAEVGRWVNLLDADPVKRAANLANVTDGLALADAIGARCCVDIAGSYSPTSWFGPHPKNLSKEFFDASVENARKIIDAVKPKRAKFSFEVMGWALPDGPDTYLALVKAIDRPGFGVHLDPCNAVNCPSRYYHNTELLNECFEKLGPWIVSCHAKDLTWDVEMNVHFREVRPGQGVMDYTTWLRRMANLPGDVPLMMEHLPNAAEYDKGREYIFGVGKKAGVKFE